MEEETHDILSLSTNLKALRDFTNLAFVYLLDYIQK